MNPLDIDSPTPEAEARRVEADRAAKAYFAPGGLGEQRAKQYAAQVERQQERIRGVWQ